MATSIVVNSKTISLDSEALSYEELCELAGKNPQTLPTAVYSWRREDGWVSGSLVPGESVQLRHEMRFEVVHTGNA